MRKSSAHVSVNDYSQYAEIRPLVVIPTYNEKENLAIILKSTLTAVPTASILVVDDESPDGTGELADELAQDEPRVHVLHRGGKRGLGMAYLAGIEWALQRGYRAVIEMDADGSHNPQEIPGLLDALRSADVAQGSRWVPGGKVVNWPARRVFLSRAGSMYARILLGMPVHDVTGGFRAYSASALESIELSEVRSQGYCFQIDMLRRIHLGGQIIAEVPITFVERTRGKSKMSYRIVCEAMANVTLWGIQRLVAHATPRRRSTPGDGTAPVNESHGC